MTEAIRQLLNLIITRFYMPLYLALLDTQFVWNTIDAIKTVIWCIYSFFNKNAVSYNDFIELANGSILYDNNTIIITIAEIFSIILLYFVVKWTLKMVISPFKYLSNGGGINDEKITYETKRKGKKNKRKGTY